jgi:hypothetical protein
MQGSRFHTRHDPIAGQITDALKIIGSEDGCDAGQRADIRRVDRNEPGMGVRRAQDFDAQRSGLRDQVRDVAATSSQQAVVFQAGYRVTNANGSAAIGVRPTMQGPGLRVHERSLSGHPRFRDFICPFRLSRCTFFQQSG